MASVPETILWASISALAYVYAGYPLILLVARAWCRNRHGSRLPAAQIPSVSVVVAAQNEESTINRRIANILAQGDAVREVIIGSDGSSDQTAEVARKYPDNRIIVLEFKRRRGRALVHNNCVQIASGDIVVFTDAATEFKPGFIPAIAGPFTDQEVGVASGTLLWRTAAGEGMGMYWKIEMMLRGLESDLGLLASASGACMAVRRSCYERLLSHEDIDDSAPLHAIRKGYRVVHVPDALASDEEAPSARSEFGARSRMVNKGLVSTLRALLTTNPLVHPGLWWSALSHKVLRWLTPVFTLLIFAAAFGPHMEPYRPWVLLSFGTVGAVVFVGAAAEVLRIRIPAVSLAWRLAIVNLGMLTGLLQAVRRQRISAYEASPRLRH